MAEAWVVIEGSSVSSRRRPGVARRASSRTGSCAVASVAYNRRNKTISMRQLIARSLQLQGGRHGRDTLRIEDEQHIVARRGEVGIGRCLYSEDSTTRGEPERYETLIH